MKIKIAILSLISLVIVSCDKTKESQENGKVTEYKATSADNYMLLSSSPNESVRWDKVMAHIYSENGKQIKSDYVINFQTKNFLNSVSNIDSAFVLLYPYENENNTENEQIVYLMNERFKKDFTWSKKPKKDSTVFTIVEKIKPNHAKPIKVDVTNLLKYNAKKLNYNTAFVFEIIKDDAYNHLAVVHSADSKSKNKVPTLKVYYH